MSTCNKKATIFTHVPKTHHCYLSFCESGLGFLGPINPPSLVGHTLILTTTGYFTKWFEEAPLKKATDDNVITFFEENLLPRFWVSVHIITYNGFDFISYKFHINHYFSSSYYPQGNGLAESTNK